MNLRVDLILNNLFKTKIKVNESIFYIQLYCKLGYHAVLLRIVNHVFLSSQKNIKDVFEFGLYAWDLW